MLEQFCRLIEQIDRNKPVRQAPYHFIAAAAHRRKFTEIVKQTEGLDRWQGLTFSAEEQAIESDRRLVLNFARHVGVGMREQCRSHDMEGVAIAALLRVEMSQHFKTLCLGLVSAPDCRQ